VSVGRRGQRVRKRQTERGKKGTEREKEIKR
jgi:hypothetical protein